MSLKKCIQQLLSDEELSDITLQSKDNIQIKANRCILGCRSLVFRQMLYGGFAESSNNQFIIKVGFESKILQAIIEYCYTDEIKKFSQEFFYKKTGDEDARMLVRLLLAADYFELNDLIDHVYDIALRCMKDIPSLSCSFFDETESLGDVNATNKLYMSSLQLIRSKGLQCLLTPLALSCDNGCSKDGIAVAMNNAIAPKITTGVHALSAQSLEIILSDGELCVDEFGLYRTLNSWYSIDTKTRQPIAISLTKHIRFEDIKPSLLCNTIALSGLVSQEQLNEAYKMQALQAERSQTMIYPLVRNRVRVRVDGAGIPEVNGVYLPCGESDGVFKFEKLGVWEDQETVFSLLRCEKRYWFISITAEYDRDTTIHCIDFYKAEASGDEFELLPPITNNGTLWICTRDGVYPPPYTSIVQNGQQHQPPQHINNPHSQQYEYDYSIATTVNTIENNHIHRNNFLNTVPSVDLIEEEETDIERSYADIIALLDTANNDRPDIV